MCRYERTNERTNIRTMQQLIRLFDSHTSFSDHSDAIPVSERYHHSNESIQCHGTLTAHPTRIQPRSARSLFHLRSQPAARGDYRRISQRMDCLCDECLCGCRRCRDDHGVARSILVWSKESCRATTTGVVKITSSLEK